MLLYLSGATLLLSLHLQTLGNATCEDQLELLKEENKQLERRLSSLENSVADLMLRNDSGEYLYNVLMLT